MNQNLRKKKNKNNSSNNNININININNIEENKIIDNENNNEKERGNEGNILDKLFCKTKTKPYIYYLPLTDEQVKEKLEKKKSLD